MDTVHSPELFQLAHSLYRRGFNDEEVSLQLREKGAAETILHDIISQVKNIRLTKRRKSGFLCCGIGVFLLVAGCMLTILLYNSGGDIKLAMYGLTTLGVGFAIKGLIDLLGW
ncbi:MAG: hypothetical protein U0U70_04540 [Chitinophagaceae bacterium]